jgi:hypothetical protein
MSAVAKTLAAANPGRSTARTTVSARFLAKLQEQYEQGKFTDVCVRCVVLPEQQQQEVEEEEEEEDDEDEEYDEEDDAHDVENENGGRTTTDIFCAYSPYFASSLSGEWNEAQTQTVEVVLENEQAVQDMKLLIKLYYSVSYIRDGGELLGRSTRMRLAFLGNAFEMHECVSECLGSLTEDLTPANVLSALDEVPEELCGHEAMPIVTAKVVALLGDMLDKCTQSDPPTAIQKEPKSAIVNTLVKALGLVDKLFDQGKWIKFFDNSFYTCLPLKPHVLALSPTVMEALLASDALHASTENEVYTLLGSWVHQSQFGAAYNGIHPVSVTGCLPLFERLVKFVHFQHLSFEFIGNVVTACPRANESGLLPCILRSSLVTHETDRELLSEKRGAGSLPLDRGRGGSGGGHIRARLSWLIFSLWLKIGICTSVSVWWTATRRRLILFVEQASRKRRRLVHACLEGEGMGGLFES